MRAEHTYDYAIIRVVPRVERGEFINVGVILSCPHREFLEARVELDVSRLQAAGSVAGCGRDARPSRHHSPGVPGWRRGRGDRRAAAAQPLSLAGVTAQHDHPALARPYRTNPRSGGRAGAPARDDGQRAREPCQVGPAHDTSPVESHRTVFGVAVPRLAAGQSVPAADDASRLRGFSLERPIKRST